MNPLHFINKQRFSFNCKLRTQEEIFVHGYMINNDQNLSKSIKYGLFRTFKRVSEAFGQGFGFKGSLTLAKTIRIRTTPFSPKNSSFEIAALFHSSYR